eukprot:12668985-Ditylum_brightwellii.AAC.1
MGSFFKLIHFYDMLKSCVSLACGAFKAPYTYASQTLKKPPDPRGIVKQWTMKLLAETLLGLLGVIARAQVIDILVQDSIYYCTLKHIHGRILQKQRDVTVENVKQVIHLSDRSVEVMLGTCTARGNTFCREDFITYKDKSYDKVIKGIAKGLSIKKVELFNIIFKQMGRNDYAWLEVEPGKNGWQDSIPINTKIITLQWKLHTS